MPRGRRETTLITLVNQLDELDGIRRRLVAKIQAAAGNLQGGAAPAAGRKGKGGRRKGFKLSAEARAKISAAQKKRWAKTKASK
jgi:hypothetical protein